jgi:hypothetical protein
LIDPNNCDFIIGENNYNHWDDEIDCPEVVRKEAIQYYWEEVD